MATFLNGVVAGYWSSASNTIYATLYGDVTRSGNTVTLSNMTLYLSSAYTSYGSGSYSFSVNGVDNQFTIYASGTDLGSYSLNSTSFSVTATQTSAEIWWGSYDGASGTFTVTFPSGASAPSTPSVSISSLNPHGATFNVSVSSFGVPASASGRYIEVAVLGQNSYGASYKYKTAVNVSSAAITISETSGRANPASFSVNPNTQYYYGGYAYNTVLGTTTITGTFVTTAEAPKLSVASHTANSAVISYTIAADGGRYSATYEYSTDGGSTWVTLATITDGSAASGTFTLTGLSLETQYEILTRATTTAGVTNGTPFTFTLAKVDMFLGPVNGEATRVLQLYGSVNSTAQTITKLYGSENGEAKLIHQGFGHIDYGG